MLSSQFHVVLYRMLCSLRTRQGIHFFPRIFFLLFTIFHYYNFSFPFGFSYAALATSMCFMIHSMLFFWHRYELPAIILGRVRLEQPRQAISSSPTPSESETEDGDDLTSTIRQIHFENTPPRSNLNRNQSFNTAASDRISRNSSTNGMYRQGEDDDDQSYTYFLGGEVVMHRSEERHRRFSPFSSAVPAGDPTAITEPRRNSRRSSHHQRFVNELETLTASNLSTDDGDELVLTPEASRNEWSNGSRTAPAADGGARAVDYDGDNEFSALQSILMRYDEQSPLRNSSTVSNSDEVVEDGTPL
jgi:hypothetical protein